MKLNFVRIAFTVLAAVVLIGCAPLNAALKASPAADSGFLPAPERMNQVENRYPSHRVWEAPEFMNAAEPLKLYVAPVDTRRLHNLSWWFRDKDRAAEAVRADAAEVADYLRQSFIEELARVHHGRFELVHERAADGAVLEIALVELTPTDVSRTVIGNVASVFVPGAGLIAAGSAGTVAVEGIIRYARDGRDIFMFADREKGKLAPVSLKDFTFFAHARAIVDDWALQFAELSSTFGPVQIADTSAFTLLPL